MLARQAKERFKKEIEDCKRIHESRGVKGWEGYSAEAWRVPPESVSGKRIPRAKSLSELDGDCG